MTAKAYTYVALLLGSSKRVVIDHLVRYALAWRVGWRPHPRMTSRIRWIEPVQNDSVQRTRCQKDMMYTRRKGRRAARWWPEPAE